jgi:TonB family protein
MRLCGLRLLAAPVTFGVGVAVSALWGLASAPARVTGGAAPPPRTAASQPSRAPETPPPASELSALELCKLGYISLDAHELLTGGQNSQGTNMVRGLTQGLSRSKPVPRYPPEAKAARVGGTVTVQAVVGEDGKVLTARAVSGPKPLRAASVEAACRSAYAPTFVSGRPVKVAGTITYNFVLQ